MKIKITCDPAGINTYGYLVSYYLRSAPGSLFIRSKDKFLKSQKFHLGLKILTKLYAKQGFEQFWSNDSEKKLY